jgi:hypothetical protein
MNLQKHLLQLALILYAAAQTVGAQQAPLTRHFLAGTEVHYRLTLEIKAESNSVIMETHADRTYISPISRSATLKIHQGVTRKVISIQPDGSAQIEEQFTASGPCDQNLSEPAATDTVMQKSLESFCTEWLRLTELRYFESPRGLQKESSPANTVSFGEAAPPLLALWLRHAARASVILPDMPFSAGTSHQTPLQPSSSSMRDAHGSETAEWLDASGATPSATLHVVQQLSWKSDPASGPSIPDPGTPANTEAFFSDSLTTLSLLDSAVLRASRTASRTTTHPVDPVPGLPNPPDFSSKLALTVTIERVP